MNKRISRRGFLSGSVVAGAGITGFLSLEEKILLAAQAKQGAGSSAAQNITAEAEIPMGQIGNIMVSRLIAGGNLLSGWVHQRDLLYVSTLAEAYLTKEKQFETLALMERQGINTIAIDLDQQDIFSSYKREYAGAMKSIVSIRQNWGDWSEGDFDELKEKVNQAIDKGADMMYMHGGYCDKLVEADKPENIKLLGKGLEYIRTKGFAAGLGSHSIYVPIECEKAGIEPDYYFKTFHHDQYWSATPKEYRKKFSVDGELHLDHNSFHDNIFSLEPEKTAKFMKNKNKPWIGFKVLAAGAIKPKSAFEYAFQNGCDFLCVGMFDFNVLEDVKTVNAVLERTKDRPRSWQG